MPLQQMNRTNASTERQSCVSHCPCREFSTECSSFRPFHGWTAAFQQKGLTILRTSQRLCALSAIAPAPGLRLAGAGLRAGRALVPPSPASLTRPAPLLHRQAAGVSHLPTVNLSGAITLPRSGWIRPLYRSLT